MATPRGEEADPSVPKFPLPVLKSSILQERTSSRKLVGAYLLNLIAKRVACYYLDYFPWKPEKFTSCG